MCVKNNAENIALKILHFITLLVALFTEGVNLGAGIKLFK